MKNLLYTFFILTCINSFSQKELNPNYDFAAKFSPKKIAKLVDFEYDVYSENPLNPYSIFVIKSF